MRLWGYGAFILINLLYASFYPVAKSTLARIDTAIFVALQMLCLVPLALFLLTWARWRFTRAILLRGILQGSCLGLGFLCLTLAIDFTSITETTLFSCLNGVLVVLVCWLVFRQRVSPMTWLACLCAIMGMAILLFASHGAWQGDLLAFVGGVLCVAYTFLIEDHSSLPTHVRTRTRYALLGIQVLTMAGETMLYALLHGNWHALHFQLPMDLVIFGYISGGTTLLPMILTLVMRRYVSGVLVTFLAILEPLASTGFAFLFAHERLAPLIYAGGLMAVASLVVQALATMRESTLRISQRRPHGSQWSMQATQRSTRVFLPQGKQTQKLLQCLWSTPAGITLRTLQHMTGFHAGLLYRLLSLMQQQGYVIRATHTREGHQYLLHPSYRFAAATPRDHSITGTFISA